jgi:RNA polymerase sigma-70 factor (ECF subfamily)
MSDSPNFPNAAAEMAALVAAVARQRDKHAFARLFAFYAPRVKSYLLRQGATEAVAEELVQETLLAVWRKADMFDPAKAAVGTWIFTIARNQRIDALRRTRRPEIDPTDPTLVPEPEPEPDRQLETAQSERRVRAAITQLSADQMAVVHLAFLEDKSHSEIAAALSLPLGTVKSRLRLAMQRIRTILDGT